MIPYYVRLCSEKARRFALFAVVSVAMMFFSPVSVLAQEEMRTWTSTAGTTLEARYLRHQGSAITLASSDGREIQVTFQQLSEGDQAYLRSLVSKPSVSPAPSGMNEAAPSPRQPPAENKPAAGAQGGDFKYPIGIITDALELPGNPPILFHAYLPKAFTPKRTWPALILWDGIGGSQESLKGFVGAAEENQWIIVVAKPTAVSSAEATPLQSAFLDKILQELPIDRNRLYGGGTGPGGIIPYNIMTHNRRVRFTGILAVNSVPYNQKSDRSLLYYGIFGAEGGGRWSMAETTDKWSKATNRIEYFPGHHGWPPIDYRENALVWLNTRFFASPASAKPDYAAEREEYVGRQLDRIQQDMETAPVSAFRRIQHLDGLPLTPILTKRRTEYLQRLQSNGDVKGDLVAKEAYEKFVSKHIAKKPTDEERKGDKKAQRDAEKFLAQFSSSRYADLVRQFTKPPR